LNPTDFLNYEMPLPSRTVQKLLRQVIQKSNLLRVLQTETAREIDALLPAALSNAFDGEL
jgi:hypothetical protein